MKTNQANLLIPNIAMRQKNPSDRRIVGDEESKHELPKGKNAQHRLFF
jgi:hypothetical protein